MSGGKLYLHERMAKANGLHGLQNPALCTVERGSLRLFFFFSPMHTCLARHTLFIFCAHSYALEHLNTSPRVGVCFLAPCVCVCVCACGIESVRERQREDVLEMECERMSFVGVCLCVCVFMCLLRTGGGRRSKKKRQ